MKSGLFSQDKYDMEPSNYFYIIFYDNFDHTKIYIYILIILIIKRKNYIFDWDNLINIKNIVR